MRTGKVCPCKAMKREAHGEIKTTRSSTHEEVVDMRRAAKSDKRKVGRW
jgi:hypothetical protein